ncbi:MAG: hypothetical protein COS89_04760 [Deltaproteobacteria bacterium CG07_land_8_20_14_0_80_38_7]|nr:MAG: hypothetical protein COS89_04760 [Deltaproteobacteria bacterium CG07_land_8_20_14_0_80_38_7]
MMMKKMTKNEVIESAYRKIGKNEFSQDCFQSACVRFLEDAKAEAKESHFFQTLRFVRLHRFARRKLENNLFHDTTEDKMLAVSANGMDEIAKSELIEEIFAHIKSETLRKIFLLRYIDGKKLYDVAGELGKSYRLTERLSYELVSRLKRIKALDIIYTDRITTRPIPQRVKWPEYYEDNGPVIKINPADYVPTAYHPPQHHLPADGNYTFTRV